MLNLLNLTETGLNANTAVELRKAATELGIKGASKGRKADLIAAIMDLVYAAQDAEKAKTETPKPQPAKRSGICYDCGTRRISKLVVGPELCDICYDYASWDNTHQDEDNTEDHEGCPICHPELDKRYVKATAKSRAGMVIVAKGDQVHKSLTFKRAAEAIGWTVEIAVSDEDRYVAIATKENGDTIELAWTGKAYNYPHSTATINGKSRKVRNLKEALRLI